MYFHKKLFHICKYACPNNDDDNGKILYVFLLSKIIHLRQLIFNDTKWSWILYYQGWIILILNNTGIAHLFYYTPPTPNKIWEDKG